MSAVDLVQITDCHLLAEPGARLNEVDTEATLARVLADIAAGPRPALVVATGDLAQDGEEASYARLIRLAAAVPTPLCALPGNHDAPATLARVLGAHGVVLGPAVALGRWRLLLLDSTLPGSDDGALGAERLAALEAHLDDLRGHPVLIALHHHPVAVGGAWAESVGLADAEGFWRVIEAHDNVRAVLWGHIHQAFDDRRGAVRLLGTPATAFQFAPGGEGGLARDDAPPAYRRLRLEDDGTLASDVIWVPE